MKVTIAAVAIAASYCILRAQEGSRTVWDGVFTEAQARRGQEHYNQHCAACHGDTLTGGDMSPALVGGQFLSNWNGLTLDDLFERNRKTMPPGRPGRLSREVNADILAFLLSANEFPAGRTELTQDAKHLKQIRIEATRPVRSDKQ